MIEIAPIVLLLALCLALTVQAGPVMRYMEATAQSLHAPRDYVRSVLPAPPASEQVERGRPMRRWLPFPLLTAALLALWLLLTGSLAPGTIVLGGVLALGAARALTALDPPKARFRRPRAAFRLALVVLAEIVRSNIAVARIILRPGDAAAEIRLREHPARHARLPTAWRRWPASSRPRPARSGWSTIPPTTPCCSTSST